MASVSSLFKHTQRRISSFQGLITFREKLKNRSDPPLTGMMINFSDPMSTDALCGSCDFLWYDLEHTPFSMETLRAHIMIAKGRQTPSIVRIPSANYIESSASSIYGMFAKHVLDANADAIILPQIRTSTEIERFILDCKYPCSSNVNYRRGFSAQIPSNYGEIASDEYVQLANDNILIGANIETKEAVSNIDSICSVPELDFIVIGTMDLSGSFGVPYSINIKSEIIRSAVDTVIESAKKHKKYIMYSPITHQNVEFANELVSQGVDMVLTTTDVMAAVNYQSALYNTLKEQIPKQTKT